MAKRENISVSFTPQQAAFLAECVASGRYQSASEVVRAGIRLLQDQQLLRQAELERARGKIREGAEQLDRGETVDGETLFNERDEEIAAIASKRRKNSR